MSSSQEEHPNNEEELPVPPGAENNFDHPSPTSIEENSTEEEENNLKGEKKAAAAAAAAASTPTPTTYRTDPKEFDSFLERYSARVATRPCLNFWLALVISLGVGILGLVLGEFTVTVDNAGWWSRGTLIADRHQQYWLVNTYRDALFADDSDSLWDSLINDSQTQVNADDDDDDDRRNLQAYREEFSSSPRFEMSSWDAWATLGSRWQSSMQFLQGKRMQPTSSSLSNNLGDARTSFQVKARESQDWLARRMQQVAIANQDSLGPLEGCDLDWYNSTDLFDETRLWPVWKNRNPSEYSLLDAPALQEICEAEAVTQRYLEENGLCVVCGSDSTKCLQPFSLVLFVRMTVPNGLTLSCVDLVQAWSTSYQSTVEADLVPCVQNLLSDYNPDEQGAVLPSQANCPAFFFPSMLDSNYGYNGDKDITHSSSIFASLPTEEAIEDMYDNVDSFGYGREYTETLYDTQDEDFNVYATDAQILTDMALAVGSALITLIAMVIHTRSPFLALVGLLQITLSFPLAFFVYTFVARLDFFPFLNFIGVFVIFALGADDVFVAVDKWKNARLERPHAPVQEIAAKAFPDAASAMLLTTLTTAVAFFGTAVCPVAPILCFAVFVGLLVVADYALCCLLVFPALVIYDRHLHSDGRNGCCCHCGLSSCCCCFIKHKAEEEQQEQQEPEEEGESYPSPIHRILDHYYTFLHRFRWPLLLLCAVALVLSAVRAAQIELPISADVRLFDQSDNQYEANYQQRQNLLFDLIESNIGSNTDVIWGVVPADTGNHNNPESWTKLVLDDSFEPSKEDVQEYLRDYCDNFFQNDFAKPISNDYECPMSQLDSWLNEQASSDAPDAVYTQHCMGASGLPMPQANFDECAFAWSQAYDVRNLLARDGKIEIMTIRFSSRVSFFSPQNELDEEWNTINDWMAANRGPEGSGNPYFTSEDFWWYDTNGVMLETAYTGAGIAMAAAALVILFSSRSFVLTLFATVTVGYVLTSVTAVLVAMGWTLGFLESILFAILIGISCDFVIHFSHAYASLAGHAPNDERTRFALISMGPSILAAAFTTFGAALVMLFTVISFFEKFAVILFLTIAQSTVGSFVVFLTLVDCVGPSNPTYMVDKILLRCYRFFGKEFHAQGDEATQHFTERELREIDHEK